MGIKQEITTQLNQSIGAAHTKAEKSTAAARVAIDTAIDDRFTAASLVHKQSRVHKSDLASTLREQLSPLEVKRYLAFYHAKTKRPLSQDKRQLQLAGILDVQDAPEPEVKPSRNVSFVGGSLKYIGYITKAVSKRPIAQWSSEEKEQVRILLKPLRSFLSDLDM